MKFIVYLVVSTLIFLSLVLVTTTEAASMSELEKRIDHIEKTYLENNQDVASAIARAEGLAREAATIRGLVDAHQYRLESGLQEADKHYRDLDQRLRAFEERLHILSAQMTKALAKIAPHIGKETAFYETGLNKIEEGNYLEAAATFTEFVNKYPKSEFAPLARFWIAESYYQTRDYQQAIKAYQRMVEKHPQHDKAKQATLKQGEAFYQLGLYEEAKLFLEKIKKQYPGTTVASEAELLLQKMSAQQTAPESNQSSNGNAYPEKTIQEQRGQTPPSTNNENAEEKSGAPQKDPVELKH